MASSLPRETCRVWNGNAPFRCQSLHTRRAAAIPPSSRSRRAAVNDDPPVRADDVLTLDDVLAARETIGARLHRTPTLSSATLGARLGGGRAVLKAEVFQRTGSFKPRGVLNRLAALGAAERRRGVVTWSAGNHAQAVAYAAAREGI